MRRSPKAKRNQITWTETLASQGTPIFSAQGLTVDGSDFFEKCERFTNYTGDNVSVGMFILAHASNISSLHEYDTALIIVRQIVLDPWPASDF